MPCYTPLGDHDEQLALQLKRHLAETRGEKLHKRAYDQLDYDSLGHSTKDINEDTRKLCDWCKANPTRVKDMSKKFQEWWKAHKVTDRRSERRK